LLSNVAMKTIFDMTKVAAALLVAAVTAAQAGNDKWVIHEWGTFTSLQDESGNAIGGINTDDEALPKFCHRLTDLLVVTPTEVPPVFFQGAPRCHPDVTMRLETPVLYFHPPQAAAPATGITVKASFRGGWLTEFYPSARADAPGVKTNSVAFGRLLPGTIGTLAWENLAVGGRWSGPATDAHVWASPRAVQAAAVRTTDGEAEQFLFYRGVGHLDAPLRISRDEQSRELVLRSQLDSGLVGKKPLPIRSLWLVDIQPDGKVAFRDLPPVTLDGDAQILARTPGYFNLADYHAGNLEKLQTSLRDALMAEGLFRDEAQALLNTWELSYFKSPGMRVFFMVPRAWTDSYLPLNISVPAEIDRVMVGRIELVTPEQRAILRQIARMPQAKTEADAGLLRTNFYDRIMPVQLAEPPQDRGKSFAAVNAGAETLAQFGVDVPKSYQLYLRLGRFRNTLLLDEAARRPAPGLTAFISQFGLEPYKPVEISDATSPNTDSEAVVTTARP
jgi:hypothetical protein